MLPRSNTRSRCPGREQQMDKLNRRDLPMFFQGRQQSEEFARGAWAACDLMAKIEDPDRSVGQMTAMLADEFNASVAQGGEYSRGFVAAMVECLVFHEEVGSP